MPAFRIRLPRPAAPGPRLSKDPAPAGLDPSAAQALALDARTAWPTHRIRSFWSLHGKPGAPARTGR